MVFRICGLVPAGDSMLLRLTEYVKYDPVTRNGPNGETELCRSEATSGDLLQMVERCAPMNENILLMIGTYDFLKGVPVRFAINNLRMIIDSLKRNGCMVTIIVPPIIPKLEKNWQYHTDYKLLKNFINSQENNACNVIDISPMYKRHRKPKYQFFERRYPGSKIMDRVHWNKNGMRRVWSVIKKRFNYQAI